MKPPLLTPTFRTGLALSLAMHAVLGVVLIHHKTSVQLRGEDQERFLNVVFVEESVATPEPDTVITRPQSEASLHPPLVTEAPSPTPPGLPAPLNLKFDPAPARREGDRPKLIPSPVVEIEPATPLELTPASIVPDSRPSPPAAVPAESTAKRVGPPSSEHPVNQAAKPAENPSPDATLSRATPLYRRNPEPEYPAIARRRRQEGTVLLLVSIDERGRPAEVRIQHTSGHSALDQAALNAVRGWEFEPARIGARAVHTEIEVPVRFQLGRRAR